MEKGNKKIINAWAMYDWANSVYSLVITSSIFQIYYTSVVPEKVTFLGHEFFRSELYAYHLSFAFLLIAAMSPILSSIADYAGAKKRFMQFFAYLGSAACIGLFFFEGPNIGYGILCSTLASIGYSGSIVFYNAFLPEIAAPEDQDRISAKGYTLGYIGSVILLTFNLVMVMMPDLFGITDPKLPAKISFVTVGIWWFGFSQITFNRLPNNVYNRKPEGNLLSKGYAELLQVWKQLQTQGRLKLFLIAFFLYNMGVQTVMYMAATYGTDELKLPDDILIQTILLIQLFAAVGAFVFARISKRYGNVYAIILSMVIWTIICFGAYFIEGATSFMIVGAVVGLVMGASQSLSRSTFSKMLPETMDHASYFSFYDVMEKLSTVFGTATFGVVVALSGGLMKNAVLVLSIYFMIAVYMLFRLKNKYNTPGIPSKKA